MTVLRMALENTEAPQEETLDQSVPEGDDQVIAVMADSCDDEFDNVNETTAVLESLYQYHDALTLAVNGKNCTRQTVDLARMGVQAQLNRIGQEMAAVATENFDELDPNEQGRIVLEGIGHAIKTLLQDPVLHFKHWKDIVSDAFRSVSGQMSKYEKKTHQNKAEFASKKGKLDSHIRVNMHGLWYFFMLHSGHPKDIMASITRDLGMSKYVLTQYPVKVMDAMEKLAALARNASAKDLGAVKKFAASVEKLPSVHDLFDSKYLGARYFNVTSLEKIGKPGDGKLGALAGATAISEKGSASYKAAKTIVGVGRHMPFAPIVVASSMNSSQTAELSVRDVGEIFDAAEAYLDHVRGYLGLESRFNKVCVDLGEALGKFAESAGSPEQMDEWNEIVRLGEQIEKYGKNLTRAFQRPAMQEVARSIRASKYCNYFGLRAIFNG
jgi:hypothetical protein